VLLRWAGQQELGHSAQLMRRVGQKHKYVGRALRTVYIRLNIDLWI